MSNALQFFASYWDETLLACAEFEADSLAAESVKTAIFAIAVGIEAGYSPYDVIDIGVCALISDFGISQINDESFVTERVIDKEGYREIHQHVVHTLELSQLIDGLSDEMQAICFQVHERPNGTGYPMGLTEDQIHPWAQAITVASSYASLMTRRSYRHQAVAFSAINAIITLRSRQALCGRFVKALIQAVSIYPIGSQLQLADGRTARVMRRQYRRPATPIIQIENESELQEIPSSDNQGVTAICNPDFQEEFVSHREIEFQQIR